MPYIQLGIHLNDNLGIKSVTIDHNDTGLKSDGALIETVSKTLLKALAINNDSVVIQDILSELNIKMPGKGE